jgi:hypothetical protein
MSMRHPALGKVNFVLRDAGNRILITVRTTE